MRERTFVIVRRFGVDTYSSGVCHTRHALARGTAFTVPREPQPFCGATCIPSPACSVVLALECKANNHRTYGEHSGKRSKCRGLPLSNFLPTWAASTDQFELSTVRCCTALVPIAKRVGRAKRGVTLRGLHGSNMTVPIATIVRDGKQSLLPLTVILSRGTSCTLRIPAPSAYCMIQCAL